MVKILSEFTEILVNKKVKIFLGLMLLICLFVEIKKIYVVIIILLNILLSVIEKYKNTKNSAFKSKYFNFALLYSIFFLLLIMVYFISLLLEK